MKPNVWRHLLLFPLAALTFLPLWVMLVTSFSGKNLAEESMLLWLAPQDITVQNFIRVWQQGNFSHYFFNSLFISCCITLANIFFDSLVAYSLARHRFYAKKVVLLAIAVKLMIPSAVLMIPTFLLMNSLKLYDTYFALILPMVAETFGIFILRQAIFNLPQTFEDAARLEGMGDFRIFWFLVFPLLKPSLVVVVIHSFLTSWNMYLYPLILTSKDNMRTLPLGINFYLSSHSDASLADFMATAVITAFPIFLLFVFLQNKIISSMTQGAFKD